MTRFAQFAASLLIPGACMAQTSGNGVPKLRVNYVLQCHGVTTALTSMKQTGPQANVKPSTDKLRIERRGQLLEVQINIDRYRSMNETDRKTLQKPDPYKIVAETGEGFVAVFVNGSTTLHTLTIDRSLTYGIWTESGFSFFEPQSEPLTSTVSLSCTKDKEAN